MHERGTAWRRVTSDEIVFRGEGVLYSVSGHGTAAGLIATVYDATGPSAGREVLTFEQAVNQHSDVSWEHGLHISQGLYVDMDDNGVEFLVQFVSLPSEKGQD